MTTSENAVDAALLTLSQTVSILYKESDNSAMNVLIADLEKIPQSTHRDAMIQKASSLVYSDYNYTGGSGCPKKDLDIDCQHGGAAYEFIILKNKERAYDTQL